MIIFFFLWVACAMSTVSFPMDTEQKPEIKPKMTREQVRADKIKLIRNTFTGAMSWQKVLTEKGNSVLAYRATLNLYEMPRFPKPSPANHDIVLTYAIKEKILYSLPIMTYEEENLVCIGCEDKSLHLQIVPQEGPQQHIYIPPCHPSKINGITSVTSDTIAVVGGRAITFCNIYDTAYKHKRAVLDELPYAVSGCAEDNGVLILQTLDKEQFKLYPYNRELYYLLHGKYFSKKGELQYLSDDQIQVVFLAADALRYNKQLQLTDAENKCYEALPGALKDYIDYFLELHQPDPAQ
jgi:hypothetical protein